MTTVERPLRFGVLGAARITGAALAGPARDAGHRLVAVAARDRRRAEAFAAEYGVARVHDSYAGVLADPDVEVVYNPLPNGLHGPWNLAAIAAGKHVLTEKPSASDAAEAAEVRDAAARAGVVVMEALHSYYHPVNERLRAVLDSGELGGLRHVEAVLSGRCPDGDPRWSLELAGGAVMDVGCYGLHAARSLARFGGGEPAVAAARGGERAGAPGVDEWLAADLVYPGGATAAVRCHMAAPDDLMTLRVTGSLGEAFVHNFVLPQRDDRLTIRTAAGERTEHLGRTASFAHQLAALTAHLRDGAALPTGADDAVATMELIDAAYRAAGFAPRPRTYLTP
ncbi:Gfo/Idh/MocA family oxidoreductase [Streptomyces sp. SL13]|uniref:Gfo/Idh/MocA family oxidoreductase n=1 Tax=Streptantibioticus silvisoli TaxID=2705255 RepID=A0AA90GZK8_9ACTN|nr:Gfo/Idh/MocA family oxidoreductase [Streptantibioticus silvisoli]MDI5966782.1 Gfo/Idh/MocA family oxidoreductase [Streptantibioticus silvisoli]MDI5971208.1 Gfo/Idh/MocA family oxidoreductase [Streptantibioticus silvisoli]